MKKKIIFVLEGFSNLSEANAICISDIINELKNLEVDCTVISVDPPDSIKQKNVISCTYSPNKRLNGIFRIINKILLMPISRPSVVKLLHKKIEEQLKSEKYDALIAVVNPVESAEAVKNISNIKKILYEIDPASNRYKTPRSFLEKYTKRRSIKWEKKSYSLFDIIIHMETHRKHFVEIFKDDFIDRTVYLDIPSLKINVREKLYHVEDTPYRFLYAGAFYPKLRNPDRMIQIFIELLNTYKLNIIFEIYTGKNMFTHIQKLITGFEDKILLHPYIKPEELNEIINNTDVLVDLGNSESDFLPSKPFLYIGTGKPIIHFSPDCDDVSIDYIKKYTGSLIINQNDNDKEIIESIVEFVNSLSCYYPPKKEDIEKIFEKNTTQYTAHRIVELLNG